MIASRTSVFVLLFCAVLGCKDDGTGKKDNSNANGTPNADPNVVAGNNAPTARDDAAMTEESTAVTIDVLSNDSDPDGDMLSISDVVTPSNGTAIITGDRISYTPTGTFAGMDSFTYTVSDGRGGTADATVTVSVLGLPNDPPVTMDDQVDILAGATPVTIDVLANDSDPNGDPLTITMFTPPQLGTVAQNGSNFTYTPPARMGGTDFFSYTIDDAHQSTALGRVFITVNGAPEATADFVDMLVDTTIQIDVMLNDIEPEGEALTLLSITPTSNGTATLMGNLVEYTPNTGFEGFDSFDYVISDPNGLTADGSVTIEVVPPFRGYDLAIGDTHGCRVQSNGSLACWGRGGDQLGIGTFQDARVPTQVGGATDWLSVAAGQGHSCGVRANGTLWCWGSNSSEQLGLPGQNSTNAPLQVGLDTDWGFATAGYDHTCAVKTDGSLHCVGDNGAGETGVDGSFELDTFTRVGTDFGWVQVDAGYEHTCGIRGAGSLWCWGENRNGQLGQGNDDRGGFEQRQVGLEIDWDSVSVGYDYTCGIRSGLLYCWGRGSRGQLGTGGTSDVVSPAQIGSESDWRHVSSGQNHTCGVRAGQLWCWGLNDFGQLGDGGLASSLIPVRSGTDSDWHQVFVGREFSCGTKTSGDLLCWGRHSDGQLGIGSIVDLMTPQRVGQRTDWAYVEGSDSATCAVDTAGEMSCFGGNSNGQLATNSNSDAQMPVPATGGGDWSLLGNGPNALCGIKSNGALYCWGHNWLGQLGDGTDDDRLVPTRITSQTYVSVDGGDQHGCAVQTNGSLWCWGRNTRDQLTLDSSIIESLIPVQIGIDLNWDAVDAGSYATCGLKAGSIFCWGDQLGGVPLMQGTAIDFSSVSMGGDEVCSIKTDNTLWCWNAGTTPVQVGADNDWMTISADSQRHNCGIRMDGSLWCWGDNYSGELGDGTTNDRGAPGQVGFDSDWTSVSAHGGVFGGYTCGTRAGELYCWGNNDSGQLGLGGVWYETPQPVQ